MNKYAYLLVCLPIFSTGCVREVIVEKPVPVEVPGPVQFIEIPPDLLVLHQKATIPESLTWSEAAQLWTADRQTIDILLGNLLGIQALGDSDASD